MIYIETRKKRNQRRAVKIFMALSIIILISSSFASFVGRNVTPIIKSMGEAEVRALAISGINNAIHIVIDENLNYQDFVNIQRNSDDEIIMIQLNFVKINRMARDLANLSEANISTIKTQTIEIPLGAFTGSTVFAAFGPPIAVRLLPIGSVLCNFVSSFDEMGINQTRHRLYLEMITTICIVLPLADIPLEIKMMVMIVENIIIGKVPETYVRASTQLDALDLLP